MEYMYQSHPKSDPRAKEKKFKLSKGSMARSVHFISS
jgi:hypothetical protein